MLNKIETVKNKLNNTKTLLLVAVFLFAFGALFLGGFAYADDLSDFSLTNVLDYIQRLVTFVFLPIAIVLCAGKIIYAAVAGYIMGNDVLGVWNKWYGDGEYSPDKAPLAVKKSLKGFAYGLAWVAGVWVLMTLIIQITSMLVGTIAASGLF